MHNNIFFQLKLDQEKKIPLYSCLVGPMTPKPCKKLRIRLISGHHLPKPSEARHNRIRESVIQPYVMIVLRGHPADERDYTTKVVPKVRSIHAEIWPFS